MKTKALYQFIELVRPDGFWPHHYTLEQAFGVLRWMVETSAPYSKGTEDALGLLSCKPTCYGFSELDPVRGLYDLRRRLSFAVLGRCGPRLQAWRKKFDVRAGGAQEIVFRHFKPFEHPEFSEAEIKGQLEALFGEKRKLKKQLNSQHKRAKECYGVRLRISPMLLQWRFVMEYGFDGSVWQHELARQQGKEPFTAALGRAREELDKLF